METTGIFELLNLETGEKLAWTEDEGLMYDYWDLLLSDRYVVLFKELRYAGKILEICLRFFCRLTIVLTDL